MSTAEYSHQHDATLDEVVITVIMARVTDFFGFFVYAVASALVFPKLFFPMYDPLTATLLSFAIFALAFLVRPLANPMSRMLQARIGKPGKVVFALMLLGTSTVAIGLLPGYEKIGWAAPVLLAVLRILQGLGLGGSWDGLTLQLQHVAPANRQGLYAMVPQLGGPIGFVVAVSLFYVLTGFLTEEEFLTFGWRFTFFAVMAVNVVSLFARLRLLNADLGVEEELVTSAPLKEVISTQWRTIMLSAFLPLASYALFHMVTVFPLGYTTLFTDRSVTDILLIQMAGGTLAIFTVILSGILVDRFSRRLVLSASTALIVALALMIGLLDSHPALFLMFGFAIFGLAYGQASAIAPRRFALAYRYSGTALATNLSWIFGAAFAPLVGLGLVAMFGLSAAALYLLSGAVVTFAAIRILNRREAS
ncbi:MFS transporter [Thalassobius sp. Cn5-15]|uniref:MFS transporter n=1 Tax=Thalassobius sp. Cn5-15 TaxID=2917763 RepID=UPI001EF2607E|nr:MFS transporter [Thalassobius sp. Cn5-15]MCG7494392.1 MFS transporter [Thalassobius sp. Cn5-15]